MGGCAVAPGDGPQGIAAPDRMCGRGQIDRAGSGNTAGRKQGNIANSHAAFSFRAVVTVAHHAVSVYTEHFDEGQRA